MENLSELSGKLSGFLLENGEQATLAAFLEEVSLLSDLDRSDLTEDKITLMTIHGAKGLEFPTVFLVGLSDGLFPGALSIGNEPEMEEERRLCYVGITRAEEELYLSSARSRMVNGQTQYFKISRFFEKLPDALVEKKLLYRAKPSEEALFQEKMSRASYGSLEGLKSYGLLQKGFKKAEKEKPAYSAGDRVSHIKFGEGTVVSVEEDTKDYLVTVLFDTAGQKKMMAGFAKLKML